MTKRVLIIGGYGNFGSYISRNLAREKNITVVIAGRSLEKAQRFVDTLDADNPPEMVALDIHLGFEATLQSIKPDIVIHTSGPFQSQGYEVAEACIHTGVHYIDLADARDFVAGIESLTPSAEQNKVMVVSGASSVPCLTSALVDHYLPRFKILTSIDYGITTAQRTARGLATTAAILGYTGKPFKTIIDGTSHNIYGWQSLHLRKYEGLGRRFLGNCDIPDLELFPKRYPDLQNIRFYAGLEIPLIHITLWALSWLVRIGLIKNLQKSAPLLLHASYLFDFLGSANSAFHIDFFGIGNDDKPKKTTFEIIAQSGDGPYIPCTPAIILTKKLASGAFNKTGAIPCIGLITRDEYLNALAELDISWREVEH